MKKVIALILIAPFFLSCSSDEEKEPEIEYIDNKILEGTWTYAENISFRDYYIFENNEFKYEDWAISGNKIESEINYGKYRLSKDTIYRLLKNGKWSSWNYYKLEKNSSGGTDLYLNVRNNRNRYIKIEELDRKIVEGEWSYYSRPDRKNFYIIFRDGRVLDKVWKDNKNVEIDLGAYKLMSDKIIYEDLKEEYFYKLEQNVLTIYDKRAVLGIIEYTKVNH